MGTKNKDVTRYIDGSPSFAKPILRRIRKLFHEASPKLSETIKWGVPYFEYNGLVGGMARFKNHVSLGFWKSKEMADPNKLFTRGAKASMCNLHIQSLEDLPSDKILIKYVREAVKLNEPTAVAKQAKKKKATGKKPKPRVPSILAKAFEGQKTARKFYESLSPSCQRDYVEWITEAKRESTKEKRVATTIEWLSEGKKRNWKYE